MHAHVRASVFLRAFVRSIVQIGCVCYAHANLQECGISHPRALIAATPPPYKRLRRASMGQYLARRRAVRSAGMIKLYTRPINGPETRPLKLKSAARRCPPMNYDRDMPVHLTRRSHRDRETTSGFLTSSLYIPLCGGYIRGLILAVSCPLRR